jgi:hypothetical protein
MVERWVGGRLLGSSLARLSTLMVGTHQMVGKI